MRCQRHNLAVELDKAPELRVLPHRLTRTRSAPRVHHIGVGSRTLRDPSQKLSHQKRAIRLGHFFSATVPLSLAIVGCAILLRYSLSEHER